MVAHMSEHRPHAFDHPGLAFVLGDIGALGVGITLMSGQSDPVLFWIGAALCCGAAITTCIRYGRDLLIIIQMHSVKLIDATYVIVFAALLIEIIVPTILIRDRYFLTAIPAGPEHTSRIQVSGVLALPVESDNKWYINVYYSNVGDIFYTDFLFANRHDTFYRALDEKEEDNIFDVIYHDQAVSGIKPSTSQYQPGEQKYVSIIEDNGQNTKDLVTKQRKLLYIFVIFRYRDDNTPPGKFRYTEHCSFLDYNLTEHSCIGHTRSYTR